MKFMISSYGKENKTIALYEWDKPDRIRLLDYDSISNPSFTVLGDGCIFTYEKKDNLLLTSYEIMDNKMVKIDQFEVPGTGITHLVYSKKHAMLFGCSYGDGTFFSVKVKGSKFLRLLTYQKQIQDDRLSRCHCVFLNEEETQLGVVNIALDKIVFYRIHSEGLTPVDEMLCPHGSGPRHAIEVKGHVFVMTEYSNEVFVFQRESLALIQKISTVSGSNQETYGATLLFSPDMKYLYATNRGEDTIARFHVRFPHLRYDKSFSCGGKHPRHMIITRNGKYIINCNKNSNLVSFFDTELEKVSFSIEFQEPTGIVEL